LISAIWLGAAASYVQFRITWQSLLELPFVDLAAFVAAAFGPPAALWLIIGYVQLGSAIRENNFALKQLHWQTKRAADQAEVEARTLVESRTSAKRAELFPLISYLIDELNPLVAHLAVELKLIDNAQYSSAWQRFGQGDRWVFFRCILNTSGGIDSLQRKVAYTLQNDPKALALAEEFRENYANLVGELRDVEGDGLITRLVEGGNLGRLDALLKRTIPVAEPEPAPEPQAAPEPAAEPETAELDPVPAGGWTAAVEQPAPARPRPFPVETRPAPRTEAPAAPAPVPAAPAPVAPPEPAPAPKPVPEPAAEEDMPEPELPRDPQRDEARRALAEIAAALQAVDRVNDEIASDEVDEPARQPAARPEPVFSAPRPVEGDNDPSFRPRPAPSQRPLQAAQTLPREGSPFPTVNMGTPRDPERKPAAPEQEPEAQEHSRAADSSAREPLPPIPEGIRPKDEPKRRLSPIVAGLFGNRPKDG
jgi:hypothetical protein